jgi:hypothetical protein
VLQFANQRPVTNARPSRRIAGFHCEVRDESSCLPPLRGPSAFFRRALNAPGNPVPRVLKVDKYPAYPAAVGALKAEGFLPRRVQLRRCHLGANLAPPTNS